LYYEETDMRDKTRVKVERHRIIEALEKDFRKRHPEPDEETLEHMTDEEACRVQMDYHQLLLQERLRLKALGTEELKQLYLALPPFPPRESDWHYDPSGNVYFNNGVVRAGIEEVEDDDGSPTWMWCLEWNTAIDDDDADENAYAFNLLYEYQQLRPGLKTFREAEEQVERYAARFWTNEEYRKRLFAG
jgi:hypothetical protein